MARVSQQTIDELVAGELRGERYRRALLELNDEAGGWKRCALAFLQEQALAQDLRWLAGRASSAGPRGEADCIAGRESDREEPTSIGAAILAADVAGVTGAVPKRATAASGEVPIAGMAWPIRDLGGSSPDAFGNQIRENPIRGNLVWMSRLTSLAALFMISFTVGWFGSDLRDIASSATSRAEKADKSAAVTPAGSPTAAAAGTRSRPMGPELIAAPTELGQPHYQFVGEEWIPFEQDRPDYLEQLQRNGLADVESFDAFVPVYENSDGVLQLVPVRQYRVRPKVFSY